MKHVDSLPYGRGLTASSVEPLSADALGLCGPYVTGQRIERRLHPFGLASSASDRHIGDLVKRPYK